MIKEKILEFSHLGSDVAMSLVIIDNIVTAVIRAEVGYETSRTVNIAKDILSDLEFGNRALSWVSVVDEQLEF